MDERNPRSSTVDDVEGPFYELAGPRRPAAFDGVRRCGAGQVHRVMPVQRERTLRHVQPRCRSSVVAADRLDHCRAARDSQVSVDDSRTTRHYRATLEYATNLDVRRVCGAGVGFPTA